MKKSDSRIFVYTPQDQPGDDTRYVRIVEDVRSRLFSPIGTISVWLLAIGIGLAAAFLMILTLPEDYAQLATGFGLWLVLGLAVLHWWMPPAQAQNPNWEGMAVAGWHVLLSLLMTGLLAWLFLFSASFRPSFVISDVPPVAVVSGVLVVLLGIVLTIVRGYRSGQALRYAWTLTCLLGVWMSLWLVAVHAGL